MPTLEGFADDLFRVAETIDRRRIDQIDALVERFPDRGDGFAIVAPAPHPTAHRPRSEGNTRYLQRGSRNMRELGIDLLRRSLTWLRHGSLLLVGCPRLRRDRCLVIATA